MNRLSAPRSSASIAVLTTLVVGVTVMALVWPYNSVDNAVLAMVPVVDGSIAATAAGVRLLGTGVAMAATVVVVAGLWLLRRRRTAALLAAAYAASMTISIVMKVAVDRPRPHPAAPGVTVGDAASFPSTSVVSAVVFWGFIFALVRRSQPGTWWRRPLLAVSLIPIVFIGPARIAVSDHWASDVVAGYLLAALALAVTWRVDTTLGRRHGHTPEHVREASAADRARPRSHSRASEAPEVTAPGVGQRRVKIRTLPSAPVCARRRVSAENASA